MENKIEIIRKNEFQTSRWSGGTTTQLYIYPKDKNYAERNFTWRLSSAKVEVQESLFTHLPGISRIIMIIEGEIVLQHEGKHTAVLHPFEQDSFMGDWTTNSIGKVTDFNLMMAEGCTGRLELLTLDSMGYTEVSLNELEQKAANITNALYVVNGDISVMLENNTFDVYEGDLFLITKDAMAEEFVFNIYNNLEKESRIIRAIIFN